MITSFIQYLLMAPSYIAVLNVYAVSPPFYPTAHDEILHFRSSRTCTMFHGAQKVTIRLARIWV